MMIVLKNPHAEKEYAMVNLITCKNVGSKKYLYTIIDMCLNQLSSVFIS